MDEQIEAGFMAFLAEGKEGIGGVRAVANDHIVVYIENAGDFVVPLEAVHRVHDGKVVVDVGQLDPRLREAIAHAHDREEPGA